MSLKIIWNDILDERADAIVTPASRNPEVGTGLDKVVHAAAGKALENARKKLGRIEPGKIGVTPPFRLAKRTGAKYVIHALGPIWTEHSGARDELVLDGCYLRILLKAVELGCSSIAIPVLSSGKFGMPMDRAVDVAVKAIDDFLAAFKSMEVKLVGIDEDFYKYAMKKYPDLTQAKTTSAKVKSYRDNVGSRDDDPESDADMFVLGGEDGVFGELLLDNLAGDGTFRTMFQNLWRQTKRHQSKLRREAKKKGKVVEDGDFIVNKTILAERSEINENTIKHFCTGGDRAMSTSKDNIIALSAAMNLPLSYLQRLLATCGYRLGNSLRDRVVRRFFESGKCGLSALDTELSIAKCPLINAT